MKCHLKKMTELGAKEKKMDGNCDKGWTVTAEQVRDSSYSKLVCFTSEKKPDPARWQFMIYTTGKLIGIARF